MAKAKKSHEDDLILENNPEDTINKRTNKKRRRKKTKLPIILIFLVLAGIGLVFALNLFDLRTKYINPLVKNIPIVNNLLDIEEEPEFSVEELKIKLENLEVELENLTQEYEDLNERYEDRGKEILKLKKTDEDFEKLKKDKEDFDKLVASKDPKSFISFYEGMYKENADNSYNEMKPEIDAEKETKQLINTFKEMDEESAASILENMMGTEIDLVVKILKNVDTKTSAAILGAMKTENASSIARRMTSEQ